ncbi:MAG: hypothetical protein K2R98_02590 [Gemmataceae bacterium]|nr:hypothetical protein [Gemmataceae bacterium]
MTALRSQALLNAAASDMTRPEVEIVEMSLLLPSWQAAALENAAQDQGLTTAQMVRQLIRDFFNRLPNFSPTEGYETAIDMDM